MKRMSIIFKPQSKDGLRYRIQAEYLEGIIEEAGAFGSKRSALLFVNNANAALKMHQVSLWHKGICVDPPLFGDYYWSKDNEDVPEMGWFVNVIFSKPIKPLNRRMGHEE